MGVNGIRTEVAGQEAYIVKPERPSRAGVLVLPTYGGVNAFARDYADSLAEGGLNAVVWNPYPTKGDIAPELAMEYAKTLTDDQSLKELSLCLDYLFDELKMEKVGIVGFCLGGRTCLLLPVHDKRVSACVCVYPTVTVPPRVNFVQDAVKLSADIECPVQLVYPGQDKTTPIEVFKTLQETLQRRAGAETAVHFFPEASHGFMHNRSEANDAAAAIARPHTVDFLRTYLL